MLRSTYAVIHLDAIDANIQMAKSKLNSGVKLLAVIKANAYGHGLCEVGKHLDRNDNVDMFGVALCEEGIRLRESGVTKPILILGVTDHDHFDAVVKYDLTPAVFTPDHIRFLSESAASQHKKATAHLKIDTGMHRIGVCTREALQNVLDAFDQHPNVSMDGVFTHFAKSENDPVFTAGQAALFEKAVGMIHARGYHPTVHASNSAAILNASDRYAYDMVRLGIAMYGCHPDGISTAESGLVPAMSLITHISNLKTLDAGAGISYGQKYTTTGKTIVATLPIGYGDGYKRCLSSRSSVLIH